MRAIPPQLTFPPHHVSLPWALALLVGPPPIILALRSYPLAAAALSLVWLACGVGVAIAALLDWSRTRPNQERLFHLIARRLAQSVIALLGTAGVAAGVTGIVRLSVLTHAPLEDRLLSTVLCLAILVGGVQVILLPVHENTKIHEP